MGNCCTEEITTVKEQLIIGIMITLGARYSNETYSFELNNFTVVRYVEGMTYIEIQTALKEGEVIHDFITLEEINSITDFVGKLTDTVAINAIMYNTIAITPLNLEVWNA